jgi:hypothetical protein
MTATIGTVEDDDFVQRVRQESAQFKQQVEQILSAFYPEKAGGCQAGGQVKSK